jgi:hypothetical protein
MVVDDENAKCSEEWRRNERLSCGGRRRDHFRSPADERIAYFPYRPGSGASPPFGLIPHPTHRIDFMNDQPERGNAIYSQTSRRNKLETPRSSRLSHPDFHQSAGAMGGDLPPLFGVSDREELPAGDGSYREAKRFVDHGSPSAVLFLANRRPKTRCETPESCPLLSIPNDLGRTAVAQPYVATQHYQRRPASNARVSSQP